MYNYENVQMQMCNYVLQDLTMGDVERMKGFVEHLRQLTQRQREHISTIGKLFSELK